MSQFGQFNQSNHQVFVSGVPVPLASGVFKDLAPQQIGLFAIDELGQISVASGLEDGKFVLAQGRQDFQAKGKAYGGGYSNAPRKTKEFKAEDIVSFKGIKSNRNQQGHIIALGYDGVDASKTLTALLDVKDLRINVRLWGNLIHKVTGNRKSITTQFYINKGCLSNGCDVNSVVAGEQIADSLIKQIENSYLQVGFKFTDLVQVRKIKKYAVDPSPISGLIPFHKFSVTICDDGSSSALGLIQSQYVGKKVTRIDRQGSNSTYEIWTQDTFDTEEDEYVPTVPASVSLSARTVAECETCPSGSTKVDSAKGYLLEGLVNSSAPTIPNAISTTLLGATSTKKSYLVVMPDTTSDATVATEASTDGYTSKLLSTTRDICNFTASTYAWTQTGSADKAPKTWKITLQDTQCGTDRLAELQANYAGYTVATDADGNCNHTYTIVNYSEPVEPGCYPDDYRFTRPSAFEGINWTEFTTTLSTPDCTVDTAETPCVAVGVVFESKIEENPKVDSMTYGYYGYDQDRINPVHIEISVQSLDQNSNPCDEPTYPVTKLQSIKMPRGEGRWVMERERGSIAYEMTKWSINPIVNKAFGFELFAQDGKFYDEYQLEVKHKWKNGGFAKSEEQSYLYSFYFEEGQGKQFETLINGLIAKQGLKVKPVYL